MPRKAAIVECDEATRARLQKIANSRTIEARLVQRAKLVLACIDGHSLQYIVEEYGVQVATIIKWRDRFKKTGINSLDDEKRSGKPKTYTQEFEKSVLQLLEETPPDGLATWDGPSLANRLNVSPDAVWRFLKRQNICLARQRSWCISTDPEFSAKAADIIGLYLNPPERAIVIAVDEKPTIQALERRIGYVETRNKKVVRGMQSTYKRHGTVNLFGALEVASGLVSGKVTNEKKRVDFLLFMDDIIAGYSPDQELHIIMDNHSIHKKADDWLTKHPNVHFHYTPTSASWLNMVEIWFGIFTRKVLRGASFKDTDDLAERIMKYIDSYKESAHPFVWKKREVVGSQLRDKITNLRN